MITFHTKHLNKRLYQRMFENLCLQTGISSYEFLKRWDIHIVPLEGTYTDFFGHSKTTSGTAINPDIPSGVTGQYEMYLWLNDTNNEFIDRSNHVVTMHEFCHARLYERHGTNRFTHQNGEDLNWVTAVHNKIDYQGRILEYYTIEFWYWKKVFWSKVKLNIIDIREHL